ncbi:MAG: C_GCAxxG_C_C family protein [Geothrix sp.]|nr:C_GCAxxG_C_C family protein [Geothrix sp.]
MLFYLASIGGIAAAGGASSLVAGTAPEPSPSAARGGMAKLPWPYKPLDPEAIGNRAYQDYGKAHCMYGTFEAIVGSVAEKLGAPYTDFPFEMFTYGMGGVHGWGTLCGCLNGCAAAIQVLSANPEPVIDELYRWYQTAALPDFDPKGIKFKSVQSVAGSPLCHPSIAKWCEASGKKAYSPERKDRCGVLTAAVARKCVMLLNDQAAGRFAPVTVVDARTKSCMGCHEKGGPMENMRSKQACAPCHSDETLGLHGHQKIKL